MRCLILALTLILVGCADRITPEQAQVGDIVYVFYVRDAQTNICLKVVVHNEASTAWRAEDKSCQLK